MIIRTEGGRLRLVAQVDHARIAARLAQVWGGGLFECPHPPGPVLLAALIHDEGWAEWDASPRIDPATGRPYDFLRMPVGDHLQIYERCIRLSVARNPYTGLLVSLHGSGLYNRRYGHMPTLQYKEIDPADRPLVEQFRAGQEMLQQQLMAELKPEPLALWTHYRWLQAWDAMSVFLCLRLPGEGRTFEVGAMPHCPGGPEEVISIATEGDGRFTVSPWPFGVTRLDVTLPARFVPDRAYIGDQEFQAAFGGAPLEQIPLVIVPE